jgi:hypothetical protein
MQLSVALGLAEKKISRTLATLRFMYSNHTQLLTTCQASNKENPGLLLSARDELDPLI